MLIDSTVITWMSYLSYSGFSPLLYDCTNQIMNVDKLNVCFTGSSSNVHNDFALEELLVTEDGLLVSFRSWGILQHQPVNLHTHTIAVKRPALSNGVEGSVNT